MTYDFTLSCALPAAPEAVYDAWLDSAAHSAMTGGEAKIRRRVGDRYSAWDGYIEGATLELVPGKRIVQFWRTSEFEASDPDDRRRPRADQDRDAPYADPQRRARRPDQLRERRLAG